MPILDGHLVIANDVPTFVVPVLIDRPGGNHSLVQQINPDNQISSFFEVEVGNNYEIAGLNLEYNVGDQACWGFRSLSGDTVYGDFAVLKEELASRLFANEFDGFPLIESQIAKFCDLSSAYLSALAKSFDLMQRRSKLAAAIWRDCSVLLPLAKEDLARFLPARLNTDIDGTRLISMRDTIVLELPPRILEFVETVKTNLALPKTLGVGNAFGLTSYAYERGAPAGSELRSESTFEEPYGEVVPFTSIGDVVAKNSPSYSRVRRLIPPWVTAESRPVRPWPLVTFCIVDLETITRALAYAKGRGTETIKIAIVTSPISFGTRRGYDFKESLEPLRSSFDYIFIVENHILQKPVGTAPRLSASSRAVKYVKACVDGVMQLIWASRAPSTRKEFLRIFPRDGFGLVGRALGTKTTTAEQLLRDAIGSTLNERLPLHYGRRLLVVGPPSMVDSSYVLSFLDKAADATLNQTMSVVSTSRRTAVTLLGFGIRPIPQTDHRLREFCLELLHTRGFSVLRDFPMMVLGEFLKGKKIAVGFSSSEGSLSQMTDAVRKRPARIRCVMTNFALSQSIVEYFWRRRVAVFHYSLLDIYLSKKMMLPPSLAAIRRAD